MRGKTIPWFQKAHTDVYKSNKNQNSFMKKYYQNQIQTGHGSIDYYAGSTLQRGEGFGDIIKSVIKIGKPLLKSAFRASKPFLKKGAKRLGSAALNTTSSVLSDVLEGKNLKKSIKKSSGREFERLKNDSINTIQNVLRPPLRPFKKQNKKIKTKKQVKRRNRKIKKSDNFGKY